MVYGDLQFIDLIIFAGVAIFLIYRLRNVLGRRTGYQKNETLNDQKEEKINKSQNDIKIPHLKENEEKFVLAYKTMQGFDHKNFLEGAKFAFETIINAFNSGDRKTLKGLLTEKVYNLFIKAIEESNNNPNYQFYSLVVNGVENVVVEKEDIFITIKITSEQLKENDEDSIIKKQDTWTFQKKIKSNSPQWLLSST